MRSISAFILFFPTLVHAQPAVKLPAEVTVAPGRIAKIPAETAGKTVKWLCISDDADLVPMPEGKLALFSSPKPGRYAVYAWTATGDVPSEAVKCVVIVGDPSPPADPLLIELRKQFQNDTTPDKAKHIAQLAALYREAVTFADRADVTTAGDLAGRIRQAASTLLPVDALTTLRKRLAEEIAKTLPLDSDKPLDAATRAAAAALFDRIATALEGLK
ncbi:hypothetical protein BH11PLA2_BH11PLA2_09080 [soil metagenome]